MEFTKKDLLNLVEQTSPAEMDIDEMSKWKNPKVRKVNDENGNQIGYDLRVNPADENSSRIIAIFTCGDEIQDWMEKHPGEVEKLYQLYGKIKWTTDKCVQRPPTESKSREYYDINGYEGGEDVVRRGYNRAGAKPRGESTAINRKLKDLLVNGSPINNFNGLDDEKTIMRLDRLSLPPFAIRERENVDQHTKFTNDRLEYVTRNFVYYNSSPDFLKAVMERVTGKPVSVPYKFKHLQRQSEYLKNRRWEDSRKQDNNYQGKTPVYGLDALGLDEDKNEVVIKSTLNIKGELTDYGEYTWTVDFTVNFGKKLKDEVTRGLEPFDNINITKSVEFQGDTNFNNKYTVLDNVMIYQTLVECLKELVEKFMVELKPIRFLGKANVDQTQINEQKVNKIVDRIMKQIKL